MVMGLFPAVKKQEEAVLFVFTGKGKSIGRFQGYPLYPHQGIHKKGIDN